MRKFVIMMILILTAQTVSSQEVVTDTIRKTITLSREKKIDVAKIIRSEEDFYKENALLKEQIRILTEQNKSLQCDLDFARLTIMDKMNSIVSLQSKVITNNEQTIKKTIGRNYGIYAQTGFITEQYGGLSIGGSFVKEKIIIGAGFIPKTSKTEVNAVAISVGFKVF